MAVHVCQNNCVYLIENKTKEIIQQPERAHIHITNLLTFNLPMHAVIVKHFHNIFTSLVCRKMAFTFMKHVTKGLKEIGVLNK